MYIINYKLKKTVILLLILITLTVLISYCHYMILISEKLQSQIISEKNFTYQFNNLSIYNLEDTITNTVLISISLIVKVSFITIVLFIGFFYLT